MKVSPSPILVFAGFLLTAAVAATADTVTLKSGEILNGKILSESAEQIVMNVTIASGITDEKTIAKSDVQSVSKKTADATAYEAIKDYKPDTRSLQPAAYVPILKALDGFLKAHPASLYTAEVKKTLDAFKQEQARVKAGDLKWDNRWYTAKEAEKNKYELGGQMMLSNMRDQASNRDFISALNTFSQIEKYFGGSSAFPDSVELAQAMMRVAAMDMVAIQNKAKLQESQFNSGIELIPEPKKSQTIAARKAQIAAAEAALAASDKAGVKWKPLLPLAPKSFEALKGTLSTEAPRLEKFSIANMRSSLAATKAASEALAADQPEEADAKIKEAQSLWPENAQIATLNAELKARPTPTPTPKATPTPEGKDSGKEKKNSAPHASPKA